MSSSTSTGRLNNFQRAKKKPVDLIVPLIAIVGLYWFSASFFLAKRTLPFVSRCDEARTLFTEVLSLSREQTDLVVGVMDDNDYDDDYDAAKHSNNINNSTIKSRNGCWLPRRIDSLVILVVDALRFDFARDHLPMSIGSRISPQNKQRQQNNQTTASQLLQFVADPPTVTMQRLKGLTTGSLPTFADISGSMVRM
jgi:phosphatidylinositol glycan class O